MQKRLSHIFAAFLLLTNVELTWSEAGVCEDRQQEETVREFIVQFTEAWNKPDIEQIASMFAPEAPFLTPSGHAANRRNIEQLLVQERMEFFNGRHLALSVTSVVIEGKTLASVQGTYTLDGYTAAGFASAPSGSIDFQLQRRGNSWNIEKA